MMNLSNTTETGARTPSGRFRAGVSGNPGGRPKGGASLTATLRRMVDQDTADKLAQALIDKALGGDVTAMKIVLDRVDGPVVQATTTVVEKVVVEYIDEPLLGKTGER